MLIYTHMACYLEIVTVTERIFIYMFQLTLHDLLQFHLQGLDDPGRIVTS